MVCRCLTTSEDASIFGHDFVSSTAVLFLVCLPLLPVESREVGFLITVTVFLISVAILFATEQVV